MTALTAAEVAAIDARFAAGEVVWMWCIHHTVRLEALTESLSKRISYIKTQKAEHEQATRLAWLQPVRDVAALPAKYVKAWATYAQAWAALDQAWAAYDKARAAYDKARAAHVKARDAYDQARAAYEQAWATYDKARAACDKARAACQPELEALHRIECPDCPWGPNGLIF